MSARHAPGRASTSPRSRSVALDAHEIRPRRGSPDKRSPRRWRWVWSERMRARRSPGSIATSSPTARQPPVSVPVATVPGALDREHAIDEQPRRAPAAGGGAPLDHRVQCGPELVEPLAGGRRDRHDRARRRARCPRAVRRPRARRSRASRRPRGRASSAPRRRSATPSTSRISRCSSDCGFHPSSAATTNSTSGAGPTPASMLRMNRSWPGTSTNPTSRPLGSSHHA